MSSAIPPGVILLLGALLVGALSLIRGQVGLRIRQAALLATPLAAGAMLYRLWHRVDPAEITYRVADLHLHLVELDGLSKPFAIILIGVTLIGAVYALHLKRAGEHVAALLYAAGAVGVVCAGDWLTLFVWWELMGASSVFLVWYRDNKKSLAAGYRYFLVHTAGGGLLLAGILLHLQGGGSMAIGDLHAAGTGGAAFWLILLGVGLNAAIPPLHAWLPDAYAEGTVTGAIFMSALTTKTAVYVLLRVFPGTPVLLYAGVIMALYGVVFAVLENDIRRLLAYHIVSQVGYMVAAAGIGTQMAVNGGTAHAFCHILYKSLLFMGAGAVIQATGFSKLTELGGVGKKMKWVMVLYGVGAVSISGFPFFNGFVSKSMIIASASEAHYEWAWLLLTLASVGTFLHTGLKLLYFTFLGPDEGIEVKPIPRNMLVAMGMAAAACTFFGLPAFGSDRFGYAVLYHWLPYAEEAMQWTVYSANHVFTTYQLLFGTLLGFVIYLKALGGEATITLDTDWPYRRFARPLIDRSLVALGALSRAGNNTGQAISRMFTNATVNPIRPILRRVLPETEAHAYDADLDRLPLSATVGATLFVFALLAMVYWLAGWLGAA